MSAVFFTCLLLAAPADDVEFAPRDAENHVLRQKMLGWVDPERPDDAVTHLSASGVILFAAWLVLFGFNFALGIGQKRDGRGTWRRLTWVAAAFAGLQTAPLAAYLAILLLAPSTIDLVVATVAAAPTVVICGWVLSGWMRPPFRWPGTRQSSPLLEDEVVLARVRELAATLGMAPPTVRVLYSDSGYQEIQAYAAGLAAPSIEVADGTLYRLSLPERDVILAHELAHFANRSMWCDACVVALCGVAAVVVSGFFGLFIGYLFALACHVGLWHIVSRYYELDCDRRAAEMVGFQLAAAFEWKQHAEDWVGTPAWVEFLFSSISTHPSCDERAAFLHRAAPADDKPEIAWNPRKVRWRRLTSRAAAAVWLAGIAAPLVMCGWSATSWLAIPLLLSVSLAAWGIGHLPSVRWHEQFRTFSGRLRFLAQAAGWAYFIACGFVAAWFADEYLNWEFASVAIETLRDAPFLTAVAVVAVALGWLIGAIKDRPDEADKLDRDMTIAICSRDFAKAIELAEAQPGVLAASSMLRGTVALVRAALGDTARAIDEFEEVLLQEPYDTQNWLHLAGVYLGEKNYQRALYLALEAADQWPDGGSPHLLAAGALRGLLESDGAQWHLERALEAEPYLAGDAHAVEALIALDRGDLARANERLARAEYYLPGTTLNRYVAAALAVAVAENTGDAADRQDAAAAIAQAQESVRNNPLALLDNYMAALVERFEAR